MTPANNKESVLVLDASAKCAIPIVESCVNMGLRVVAASTKKHCCGFYCRGTSERLLYPSPIENPIECLEFLLNFLKERSISMVFPLGHLMTAFIAEHQNEFRKFTSLAMPSYDIFVQGLNKILTLKAAHRIGCNIPKSWYPKEQPLESIAREVDFPVLIKPAVSVGARGITYCYSKQELYKGLPKIEAEFGESMIQEFIPQTGTQYKCAMIVDDCQNLLSGIVYEKLRYYPTNGGSSTLNKSVERQDILQSSLDVAKELKWFGPCDFDYITDPRDNQAKLMEINPRFSDTYKMTAVAGLDMTKIAYQLAKGEKIDIQLDYKKNKYLRFIFGDIMWFLTVKTGRWSAKPSFFNFFNRDTTYLMTGNRDIRPFLGYILENLSMLWNKEERAYRLRVKTNEQR